MRRLLPVLIVLVLAGCSPAGADSAPLPDGGAPDSGTHAYTLRVGETVRDYRVHVPERAAGGSALSAVVVLHGAGGNGGQVAEQTGFDDVADREGFLTVYPDGSGRTKLLTWNAGTCCSYARDQGVDDVGFLEALIDTLTGRFGVGRVYVTGFSNGAMLAYRLGCELADRLTAIAPVSGALDVPSCTPSRPLPVYAVHGDADPIVPYTGGPATESRFATEERAGSHRSVADAIDVWTGVDGCTGPPVRTSSGTVTTERYTSCAAGTEVRLDTVSGGGHAWPGGRAVRRGADEPTADLDASESIWRFFATHTG